jgi:quercetin dioxygenase-like cupin family protein
MPASQDQQRTITVDEVGAWPVDGFEGHEARILTIDIPVGQQAPVHSHPGSQYIWVARGLVNTRLSGQEPHTYGPGEAWYEPSGRPHTSFGNAGDIDAQVVVFYVTEPGQPVITFADNPT